LVLAEQKGTEANKRRCHGDCPGAETGTSQNGNDCQTGLNCWRLIPAA
jgi:hypothetical protein